VWQTAVTERQRGEKAHSLLIEDPEPGRIVDSLPGRVQEGSLDVDAEYARHALFDGRIHRPDRAFHGVEIVADQRRQEPGRAEAPMRLADGGDAVDRRMIVEQDAAAAIHLQVDEAREKIASQLPVLEVGRALSGRHHADDQASVHEDAPVRLKTVGRQDARGMECDRAHRVSVTLRRCGGRSGSNPLARLSDTAKR